MKKILVFSFKFYLLIIYNMEMKVLGFKFRLEVVIASIIVGILLGCHVLCSCVHTETAKKKVKEGMAVMGAKLGYDMSQDVPQSWGLGRKVQSNAQDLNTHQTGPLPLPAGQLDFFADTQFKPECCVPPASGFSSSGGCACISTKQVDYINQRGGNRTICSGATAGMNDF